MSEHAAQSCPRCGAPARGTGVQLCAGCQKPFALYAGAALDPGVVVSPAGPAIRVKNPGLVLIGYAMIDERGVAEGSLDPVIGHVAFDTKGVAWHDVATIAVWRAPAVQDVVIALLVPLPLAGALAWLSLSEPGLAGFGAMSATVFALFGAFLFWRGLAVQACRARVVGRYRTIILRFDKPFWRRRRFHDELLRRAGVGASALP